LSFAIDHSYCKFRVGRERFTLAASPQATFPLDRVRPHVRSARGAREDAVLFPAIHMIVSPHEYDALGEEFEKKEKRSHSGVVRLLVRPHDGHHVHL